MRFLSQGIGLLYSLDNESFFFDISSKTLAIDSFDSNKTPTTLETSQA